LIFAFFFQLVSSVNRALKNSKLWSVSKLCNAYFDSLLRHIILVPFVVCMFHLRIKSSVHVCVLLSVSHLNGSYVLHQLISAGGPKQNTAHTLIPQTPR